MSIKIMGLVWDTDLPAHQKMVLLAYADHADHEGRNIYPSVALIATKTSYSERSVQYTTRDLEQLGYLIADGNGPHGTKRWRIPLDMRGAKVAPLAIQGVQSTTVGGAIHDIKGVQPIAPESSVNHHEPEEEEIHTPEAAPSWWLATVASGAKMRREWAAILEVAQVYDDQEAVTIMVPEQCADLFESRLTTVLERALVGTIGERSVRFVAAETEPA